MIKFQRWRCSNGNPISIDTDTYRYWISDWEIEKFPITQICDKFAWDLTEEEKTRNANETKTFRLKEFWKGFQKITQIKVE
jgi:hypothetical protein